MRNICKRFGAVEALADVSLRVGEAEIHGLLGENGAGKSTLMNILGGIIPPDSGTIRINGAEHFHLNPRRCGELGIRFIHQELNLINDLKVFENLFLRNEPGGFRLDKKAMIRQSREIVQKLRLEIEPQAYVRELDSSRKQLVEIARALLFECRLIIMDEPTTALTNDEIENLFAIMRGLKNHGVSCIYISHKMPELFAVCDSYTVLRDGRFIAAGNFCDTDEQQITELLAGRSIATIQKPDCIRDEEVLRVQRLSCEGYFQNVGFGLRRGEILAFTGLFGDGRGGLAECLFGARKTSGGTIALHGDEGNFARFAAAPSIRSAIRAGIAMVPRNRKERSILKDLSIQNNLSMAYFTSRHKGLVVRSREENQRYETCRRAIRIRAASPKDRITTLSGGNQQKVVFSRWFCLDAEIYILDNPTQGIDVGAKFELYQLITGLAERGKSVILFSSEFPEIHKIADRCIVMYKGQINKEFSRSEFDEVAMMYYATGSNQKESE